MKLVLVLIASALVSSAAYAEHPIKVGDKYRGHVPLHTKNGKDQQVPLPEGEWLVTATGGFGAQRAAPSSLPNSGTVLSTIFMANVVDGKLVAAISFRYIAENRSTGWRTPRFCSRKNLNYGEVAAAYDGTQTDCWGVSYVRGASRPGSLKARSIEYLNSLGIKMPIVMPYVACVRADYADFLRITYSFNPELEGISPPENTGSFRAVDYHPTRIGNYPKKKAFMEKTIEWGKAWKSKVDAGFKGRLKAN